ncbi:hypothetical protein DH2020_038687 [Rehmannia glutinosa]|uniref:HTH myb-type domain-containing protein n=1 Tax=Rehmannia glutinosa TaxID=99300 RepID=A0ABR0UXX1_REHGL
MEWPDFPIVDEETLHGLLSINGGWTIEENNMFEKALAEIMPDSPAFFENIASRIPWKSIEDVQNHYQALLHDLDMIESGRLFLMGLNKYGKGDWRSISRYYVITKTPTQVASHAQKYFRRLTSSTPVDRRRPSIHDIQTVNPNTFAKSLPQRQINYNCLPNVNEPMVPFSSCGLNNNPMFNNNNNNNFINGGIVEQNLIFTDEFNCWTVR